MSGGRPRRDPTPSSRPGSRWRSTTRSSGLSVGVPGTVRGWEEALRRNGTMSMTGALGPAIRVARDGFVVDQTFVDQTQQNLDYFDDVPSTQALYLDPDGTPHDVGTVLRNPDLARTYEQIARLGAKGFCRGAVADAMAEAVQHSPVAADADFFDVPLTGLLSDGFAAERRALIDPQHAATSPVPPGGNGVVVPGWGSCSTTS